MCPVRCHAHLFSGNVHQVRWPLIVVLLPGAALLLVDGIAFGLGEAQKAADHGEVLPECPILWGRILLPAQQLTEPALTKGLEEEERGRDRKEKADRKRKSKSAKHGLYTQMWAQEKRIWTAVCNISQLT